MARRLFTLLSALSLLLCVAVVALWVFSYFRMVAVGRREQNAPMQLEVTTGWAVVIRWERRPEFRFPRDHPAARQYKWEYYLGTSDQIRGYVTHRRNIRGATSRFRAGVFEVYQLPARYGTVTTVRVPLWVLAAVTAALPLSRLWSRRRRRRRAKNNLCPACGYDLTANVSGTCPECGRCTGQGKHGPKVAAQLPVADGAEDGSIHAV